MNAQYQLNIKRLRNLMISFLTKCDEEKSLTVFYISLEQYITEVPFCCDSVAISSVHDSKHYFLFDYSGRVLMISYHN